VDWARTWEDPLLRISVAAVLFSILTTWGSLSGSLGSSSRGRCLVPVALA
jgi:hypothetical protein